MRFQPILNTYFFKIFQVSMPPDSPRSPKKFFCRRCVGPKIFWDRLPPKQKVLDRTLTGGAPRDFCSLPPSPEIWSKNNRSLHNNRFCPLLRIPGRKPKPISTTDNFIMHMGRKLTDERMRDERELGNSVMLFTCFCCCCCPSQCALPTQCPIWASCYCTHKLEVGEKYFGLLTKNYLMDWQVRGLRDGISGNILVVQSNLWTKILLVSIGAHMSYCYDWFSEVSANDN